MSKKLKFNVTHNLTLQFSTKNTVVQEETDNVTNDVNSIRSILPTKTSATRQISDLESIPPSGPFLLNFSNIPYEATETDLRNFFRAYEVINIVKSEHKRGTGIIEFKDLNTLAAALNMSEKIFINRQIRLTIGTKDDQARIQSTGNQRPRYQNQQRNPSSTLIDDTDNWRVKKLQPVSSNPPASENYSQNKEKSSWREKQPARSLEEKTVTTGATDSADNWRRTKTTQPKEPMPAVHEKSVSIERVEPRESDVKKASIFGDAKPVDTSSKDLAIEKKINSLKVVGDDTPKTDVDRAAKATGRVKKPMVTATPAAPMIPSSGAVPEWREKVPKLSKPESLPEAPPKPVEVVPAPLPATNIWQERMKKSKEASTVNTDASKPSIAVTMATVDTKDIYGDHKSTGSSPASVSVTKATVALTTQSEAVATSQAVVDSCPVTNATPVQPAQQPDRAPQKPPVVISVNGPFLDPRSRTSHHSISETVTVGSTNSGSNTARAPVAVPVVSAPALASSARQPCSADSPPVFTSAIVSPKSCAVTSQNSWAKGPPKSLIDKAEIHQ